MKKIYDRAEAARDTTVSAFSSKQGIRCLLFFSLAVVGFSATASPPASKPSFGPPMSLNVQEMIRGTILDTEGNPLPGVNIVVQGTNRGTQSDLDGAYILEARTGDTLVFSHLGMKTVNIAVGEDKTIDLTMEEDTDRLDEVIVIGYGSQSKATLTGSVTNIKAAEIAELSASNLTSLLAGRLSGVRVSSATGTPGVASNLTIRSRGTWNNSDPVYVIDGIVKSKSDFDALDINEVEEVSVLKDAASAAIYGSRAANGVVLVNTKKGHTGKPIITYTATFDTEEPTKLPEMMSGVDIARLANVVSETEWFSWSEEDVAWLETVNNGYGYDYLKEVYKDPASNRHAVSISGGNEHVRYYMGGAIFGQTGFLDPLKFDKQNLRANLEVNLSRNLTANVNLALNNSERQKFNWAYDYGDDALPDLWKKLQTWQFYQPISIDGKAPNLGWLGNVGELINNSGYWRNRIQDQSAILSLTYEIPKVKGLSAKVTYAYDKSASNLKIFEKKHELYDITGYTEHNFSQVQLTGTTVLSSGPSREGIYESANLARSYQFNTQLNYKRVFGDHALDALLVYEQSEGFSNGLFGQRYDFPILVRDQWNQTSGAAEDSRAGGSESETARLSYVGRVNYDFKSKYLFSASFRYDGSIIFKPSERWGFFPSVSAGWVISEEDFFDIGFIERLKLRASYGTVGNDQVAPWRWQEQYVAANGFYFGDTPREVKGIQYGGITNPYMTWETSESANLGLELNLTNNLGIVVDIWNKRTKDILGSQLDELPSTVGGDVPNTNYGEMKSNGFEVELDYSNNIGGFNYYIGGNYGYARDEVVKIAQGENIRDYQNRIGRSWNYIVGYEYDDILRTQADIDALPAGYTIDGRAPQLGQLNYIDLNGAGGVPDGKIDSWDQKVIANYAAPTSTYGIKLGGSFKGFSIDVFFQGAGGYKKILSVQPPYGWTRVYGIWQDHWTPDNTDASMPKPDWNIGSNQWTSTFWLKNADYLRLRYLNIGYELPAKILSSIGIERVKLFAAGTNLFNISEFKAYDVELSSAGSYPNMKSYSLGLSLTL
ncbi:TonB-linked SusC/RagA family outer membrane protein [Anseongella ginsenosidimutans]|uniref:TonB-linked SusC/RagA family outer membrane protein n=1 Tax=Anseongella ginsenosidimutans TaxID=496056 RepID=A0A4R3KMH6_9SPHI|nr:TonB-dependent receptor [Anseongella ginsenosidimutans]QEC51938.1 TonB-dependent receptor [Anseongella ginsenosidimutans]TCS85030.1 TonB-linked SusC/RagA family outer membrane protein [Anseongella ginsenosidimutans]